jgi:hypothetical protein
MTNPQHVEKPVDDDVLASPRAVDNGGRRTEDVTATPYGCGTLWSTARNRNGR